MQEIIALIPAIIAGLAFGLGLVVSKLLKNKNRFLDFSMGMAFIVTLGLISFDLAPEVMEAFSHMEGFYRVVLIIGLVLFGVALSKVLDVLIPHHHHDHEEDESNHDEHHSHLMHISLITSLPLIVHNVIEGMGIYSASVVALTSGFVMAISVMLHNIPLGTQIGASLAAGKATRKRKFLIMGLLSLGTPIGALLIMFLKNQVSEFVIGILIALTVGMLAYIVLFEYLREIIKNSNKKYAVIGMGVGVLIIVITLFL